MDLIRAKWYNNHNKPEHDFEDKTIFNILICIYNGKSKLMKKNAILLANDMINSRTISYLKNNLSEAEFDNN